MNSVLFFMLATCWCCEAFLPSFHPGSCSNLHTLKQTFTSTSRIPKIIPSRRRQDCSLAKMSVTKPLGGVEVTLPSTEKIVSILRAIGLDAPEAAELISVGKVFEASPGDDLMNEGQSVAVKRSLFLLVDGECVINPIHNCLYLEHAFSMPLVPSHVPHHRRTFEVCVLYASKKNDQ